MGQKRQIYTIKNDTESFTGYLFWDNVVYWESLGYTVTRS